MCNNNIEILSLRYIKERGLYMQYLDAKRKNCDPSASAYATAIEGFWYLSDFIKFNFIPSFFLKYYNKTVEVSVFNSKKNYTVEYVITGFDTGSHLYPIILNNSNYGISFDRIVKIDGKEFNYDTFRREWLEWTKNKAEYVFKPLIFTKS